MSEASRGRTVRGALAASANERAGVGDRAPIAGGPPAPAAHCVTLPRSQECMSKW
jgi:hypothetical protein